LISGNAEAAGLLKSAEIPGEEIQFMTKPVPVPVMLGLVKTTLSRLTAA
jgi:hypothetical protein